MKRTAKKAAKKKTAKQGQNSRKPPKGRGNVTNLKSWKPGQSGNPKGRPKKAECLTSLLREEMDRIDPTDKQKRTHKELIVLATMSLAKAGNSTALKEIWERLDGKVRDKLELTGGAELVERLNEGRRRAAERNRSQR